MIKLHRKSSLVLFVLMILWSALSVAADLEWTKASCQMAFLHFHGNPDDRERELLASLNESQRTAVTRLRHSMALFHSMFDARVENDENRPSRRERREMAERLLSDVTSAFDELGIAYEVRESPEMGKELVVLSSDFQPLGRLAGGVQRYDGYAMVFNPEYLLQELDEGMLDEENRRLYLSVDAILMTDRDTHAILSFARPTRAELHELKHLAEARAKARGETGDFSAYLGPALGGKVRGASVYSDGFWYDESPAHALDEYVHFRELRQLGPRLEIPGALNSPELFAQVRSLVPSLRNGSGLAESNRVIEKITRSLHKHTALARTLLHDASFSGAGLSKNGKRVRLVDSSSGQSWEFTIDKQDGHPVAEVSLWTDDEVAADFLIGEPSVVRAVRTALQPRVTEKTRMALLQKVVNDRLPGRLERLEGIFSRQAEAYAELRRLIEKVPDRFEGLPETGRTREKALEKIRRKLVEAVEALTVLAKTTHR
jgi:hypothetical protein